jgi:flavin reductase (DIM6/NTAB) family NADH-FMN oxidoreductase RutF
MRVKEIISLGSHDMFISDVVNISVDDQYFNETTGKLNLSSAKPLVYNHGFYFGIVKKLANLDGRSKKNQRKNNGNRKEPLVIVFRYSF